MKMLLVAAVGLAAIGAAGGAQAANAIYDYSGPDYTTVTGGYTTSDDISGTVTLAAPLANSENNQSATIVSYDFKDGLTTYTNQNSSVIDFGSLGTNTSGDIDQYEIAVASNSTESSFILQYSGGFKQDAANGPNGSGSDFAQVSNTSEFTPQSVSAAPEPSVGR